MKKFIPIMLSLVLLLGLFVSASFAEEIQPVNYSKASNVQLNRP